MRRKIKKEIFEELGFGIKEFSLDGRDCILVSPKTPRSDGKWLLKTEYFGAFPSFEIEMLNRGYYLAHIQSTSRWCPEEDIHARAKFCRYIVENFGLFERCMPVGMSCGGMQAVYLAATYPHLVSALYLDAPVMNLLSCPCGLGEATEKLYEEFFEDMGMTVSQLLNYRRHPVDYLDKLLEARKPVALVCGDVDSVVPYCENGRMLSEAYGKTDIPFFEVLKQGCDHHPHGLDDVSPLVEFAERYYN